MSFQTDGYYIERDLLDENQIDSVMGEIHTLIKNQLHINPSNLLLDASILKETNIGIYLNTLRLAGQLLSIQQLLTGFRVRRQCGELGVKLPAFQTDTVLHVVSPDYHGLGPHQDYSSTEASKNAIIVWIPLMDTEDNYPLEVIPRSHLAGLYNGKQKDNYYETDVIDESLFISLNMKKGDVLFMSVFTVHRTCLEGNFRMAASIRYEDAMDPSFIERGYPCKYRRVYQA